MQHQFFRVGEVAVNLANVTHIEYEARMVKVYVIGNKAPIIEVVASSAAGKAWLHWFNEVVPALADGTERIPIA